MIHPSYSELIEAINTNNEDDDQSMVLNSRYSLVLATSKRARQLIAGSKPLVEKAAGKKPLSIAIEELYKGKVKILAGKGGDEEISLEENLVLEDPDGVSEDEAEGEPASEDVTGSAAAGTEAAGMASAAMDTAEDIPDAGTGDFAEAETDFADEEDSEDEELAEVSYADTEETPED